MPLDAREQSLAQTFAVRVREAFPDEVLTVKVFGSRARGEAGPDSDLDVLVVLRSENRGFKREIVGMAEDLNMERDYRPVLAPLVMDESGWNLLISRERRLALDILRDGIEL